MTTASASVLVPLAPSAAFAAFTQDVDAWWKRGPAYRIRGDGPLRFEPGIGGRFVQVVDPATGEEWELGRIRVWEPGSRLVFDYRVPNFAADESTEVEVRFEARAGGTWVTVIHRGWEGLPQGHPARHGLGDAEVVRERAGWWMRQLRSLRR